MTFAAAASATVEPTEKPPVTVAVAVAKVAPAIVPPVTVV